MKKIICSIVFFTTLISGCSTLLTGGAEVTGLSLLHDRRTSKALMIDERIEVNAALELNSNDEIRQNSHFNVTAYNGTVLVTGEATTEPLSQKIIAVVRVINGVKRVHNQLVISEPSSLSSRSYDTVITTRVKSALSNIKNLPGFDATRVKVVTENKVVYLMGLVHENEANVATEVARRETGVKQVVKIFELIKYQP